MLPVEVVVVLALATYRAARIVTQDSITEGMRESLQRWAWDSEHPQEQTTDTGQRVMVASSRGWLRTWISELFHCPLCVGVWIAAGLYVLWRWSGSSAVQAGIVILGIAGAQCFLANKE